MTTLIAFSSKQGCTRHSVGLLQQAIGPQVTLLDLDQGVPESLPEAKTVIVGGPIYYGRIATPVAQFCRRFSPQLLQRRLGLFICCLETGERARAELRNAYPPELREHAVASDFFGGEIEMERLNFIERFIVRHVAEIDHNLSTLSEERIDRFVRQLLAG